MLKHTRTAQSILRGAQRDEEVAGGAASEDLSVPPCLAAQECRPSDVLCWDVVGNPSLLA